LSRRGTLGLALVAAAILALVLWRCSGSSSTAKAPPRSAAVSPTPPQFRTAELPPVTLPVIAEADAPLVPIVDEVRVERDSVCEGEESLVTVRAHTPGGKEDAFLHYMIGTELGASVPLKVFESDESEGAAPPRVVRVFGRNNVAVEVPVPRITVKKCKPARRLHVVYRLTPNAVDELELFAKIIDVEAKTPMQPVSAKWTFGDGTSATSDGPLIVHDYSQRAQDTLYSQFLVTCEVTGADGEKLVGRTSIELLNPAFEHLAYKRVVLLFSASNPRFPQLDKDGVVRQRVHVWHRHREPVTITRVLRHAHAADQSVDDPPPEEVSPMALFGTNVIGPGGVDANLELDATWFSAEYTLEGTVPDGYVAGGAFAIMRPPDKPTKENNTPVVDPLLKAKILRARELLKQEFVTDDDLFRLEAQGKFDDIIQEHRDHPQPMGTPPPLPPR
jgi:hypothetical protein